MKPQDSTRCQLQTLRLNPGAVHVWSYLRIALTWSERWDLFPSFVPQTWTLSTVANAVEPKRLMIPPLRFVSTPTTQSSQPVEGK
eukprot:scaffold1596_cov258-Chaetoceros_neogracile.AAC.2